MLRLITIPISHYCEKARWARDRAGIAFLEERHVQLIHRVAARRAAGGSTVPVLVTDSGVLGESNDILTWVDERPFLCGDAFGAADLTFAPLASPMIAAPQYGTPLPQPGVMAPATAALIERARKHPAGRLAMRMFAEHPAALVG